MDSKHLTVGSGASSIAVNPKVVSSNTVWGAKLFLSEILSALWLTSRPRPAQNGQDSAKARLLMRARVAGLTCTKRPRHA